MKLFLFAALLLGGPQALCQQIPCPTFDEHPGNDTPEYKMKGCRSFNELLAAGGITVTSYKGFKSYACFATTFPEEASDLFIFVEIAGVIAITDDKEHNGFARMATFLNGIKANEGVADMVWTQFPKDEPYLWSEGVWVGHGESQVVRFDESGKGESVPGADSELKAIHVPSLSASVDSDTVQLKLDLNNDKGAVEELEFNRRTGRARLKIGDDYQLMRCVAPGGGG
jgi:hypothetical protein